MNAPSNVILPTYDENSFKKIPLTPKHNILCNQYESTDAVDTGHESDADDETIDNDKDKDPSEDEFQESSPDREKNLWSLVHVLTNY